MVPRHFPERVYPYLDRMIACVALSFALAMVVSMAYGLYRSYSPILFWDHWRTLQEYSEVASGQLSLEMLYSQHNEHRIFFPRLLLYADFAFAQGSDLLNIGVMLAIQVFHAALVSMLISSAIGFNKWQKLAVFGCVVGAMFSSLQMENLNQGFQIAFVGVLAFATVGFWMLSSASECYKAGFKLAFTWRFGVSLSLGVVCTFTLASGILVWPLLLFIAWIKQSPKAVLAFILVSGMVMGVIYFHDYQSPVAPINNITPLKALAEPKALLLYMATYFSSPLRILGNAYAIILAVLGLIAVSGLSLRVIFLSSKSKVGTAEATLLAIALFTILMAFVTALGRLDYGIEQALSSRYATTSILFWVVVCGLALLYGVRARGKYGRLPVEAALGLILLITGAIASQQGNSFSYYRNIKLNHDSAISALLIDVADTESLRSVYHTPSFIHELLPTMRQLKLAPFHNQLAQLPGSFLQKYFSIVEQNLCLGWFDEVNFIPHTRGARVRGWAWDDAATTSPYLIVITDQKNKIHGLAFPGWNRPDVAAKVSSVSHSEVGWQGHVRAVSQSLNAYAILADGVSACLLQGQHKLDN